MDEKVDLNCSDITSNGQSSKQPAGVDTTGGSPSLKRKRTSLPPSRAQKPFRSPLLSRTNLPSQITDATQYPPDRSTNPPVDEHAGLEGSSSGCDAGLWGTPAQEVLPHQTLPDRLAGKPSTYGVQPFEKASSLRSSRISADQQGTSGETTRLRQEKRVLLNTIRLRREELDTIKQALRIVDEKKLEETQAATSQWRSAAQKLAEEVFENFSRKIDHMGGFEAWKDRKRERLQQQLEDRRSFFQQQSSKYANGGDTTPDRGSQTEGDCCSERDHDSANGAGDDQEEHNADHEEVDQQGHRLYKDVSEFSMEVMLTELNIEPVKIGYSSELQTWAD